MCFSKHLDILTSWLFLILVSSLRNIVVMFIEKNQVWSILPKRYVSFIFKPLREVIVEFIFRWFQRT